MNREEKKKMLKHDPFFIESLRGRCQICPDVTAGGEGDHGRCQRGTGFDDKDNRNAMCCSSYFFGTGMNKRMLYFADNVAHTMLKFFVTKTCPGT